MPSNSCNSESNTMPRHFTSIADLTAKELKTLVDRGVQFKTAIRQGNYNYADLVPKSAEFKNLAGQQIPLLFPSAVHARESPLKEL